MNFKIESIKNENLEKEIINKLNDLTKPIGSLGRLEEFVLQYCLCRSNANAHIKKMNMFTFAGDHGITQEGVAPYPKEVTQQMVLNMANGGAAISVMCKNSGIEYSVVDMGVDGEFSIDNQCFKSCKVALGTANFHKGPAMSLSQANQAILFGQQLAMECDTDLFGIGEMGIGNSSSASALYSLLLDMDPEKTVGPGTGASGDLLQHKKDIIRESVELHKKSWDKTGFDALCRVGGFEIAGIVGLIFGAAQKRIPTVIDGFISSAAALVAMEINPIVQKYLYFAHQSSEKFHRDFLETLNIRPILNLDMRLGEGTGAALCMQIIAQAMNCYDQMATFSSAHVSEAK